MEVNIVTGAFGYTGKYITRQLISMGKSVRTLTNHPTPFPLRRDDAEFIPVGRTYLGCWSKATYSPVSLAVIRYAQTASGQTTNQFGNQLTVAPLDFTKPDELARSMQGATTLYNTYWIRFNYGEITFDQAVANSKILFQSARNAGIKRIVHISVTNPDDNSKLPYFRGKALVEKAIRESGLSYAVIRPALIFGAEDILINNIAYLLKRFPVFAIPGTGDYKLQPIYAQDLAEITVQAGQICDNIIIDAIGPETYTFNELVRLIRHAIQSNALIIHLPPTLVSVLSELLSHIVNDVLLTKDEIKGLMANLLISSQPPTATNRLSEWLKENADVVGVKYASELSRHYREYVKPII